MKKLIPVFIVFFICFCKNLSAQNLQYVRTVIDTLAAPGMHGRGYVNDGDKIAAQYIAQSFKDLNLKSFNDNYYQEFKFPINTFPDNMRLCINGINLTPGKDFVVDPSSGSLKGDFKVAVLNKELLQNEKKFLKFKNKDFSHKLMIVDDAGVEKESDKKLFKSMAANPFKAAGILLITDNKFTWSMSKKSLEHFVGKVQKNVIPSKLKNVSVNVNNRFIENYISQNVIGYVEGKEQPDSFIVFTAHYDHLGRMGTNTYFPGANDNASGTAMLLDLANHYTQFPGKYSIAFMAFSAEEVGLIGSEYYTSNPLFPLDKIKFLINLDLMGNGEEGITVVNGTVHEEEFKTLVKLNEQNNYLKEVMRRGKAANSDHYHFSEKGVKSFFIYTMGGSKAYHDIYDVPGQFSLSEYEDLFKLINDFVPTIH